MSKQDDIRFSKSVSSFLSLFIILLMVVVMVIAALSGLSYFRSATSPLDPSNEETKLIAIEPGASLESISNLLEAEGIIRNSTFFEYYLKLNSFTNYQAGEYNLSPSMDFEEIAKTIETGTVYREVLSRVTIPEGLNIESIAETLESNLNISSDEFLELVNDQQYIETLIQDYPNMLSEEILDEDIKFPLEGYLYPATYDIYDEEPTLDTLIRQMLDATNVNSYQVYDSVDNYTIQYEGEERSLSFHEFLTLSSLIEREATSVADRSKITSVFLNRMALTPSMPLQTDPTVLYALGEHKERTLFEDLEVEDPYNTYINKGLPPGPIASPGSESIQSVMNPSNTNFYYFLADSEGNNYFAETYEEHLENRALYIDN